MSWFFAGVHYTGEHSAGLSLFVGPRHFTVSNYITVMHIRRIDARDGSGDSRRSGLMSGVDGESPGSSGVYGGFNTDFASGAWATTLFPVGNRFGKGWCR